MPPRTRAVQAALDLLKEAAVTILPVKIDDIAKTRAFVMRDRLPSDVSGMLIPASDDSKKRWIIIANKTHPLERRRFTIAHELGHILLHQYTTPHADGAQRIRYRDMESSLGTDREEIEANQFASELLMPADLVIPRLQALGLDSWNGERSSRVVAALEKLAFDCKVSQQALVIRIASLLRPS